MLCELVLLTSTLLALIGPAAGQDSPNSTTTSSTVVVDDRSLNLSALFSDMTATDVALLVLALLIILLIILYMVRLGARARRRIAQVNQAARSYAQQQIDQQSLPEIIIAPV